ncbi:ParB/RepB/Spo0J family partition protein [Sphingosinicella terrae]|uniref:ParB/RepB/Spo0J family partition protein n=1 Tax=Sphingosinicella terrae TaxID=2172047 RepID=UPI000E0DAEFD|nr:ParB/RepB/Spo0J family partition protein [Sphingosinicella terrae]
MIRNIPLSKLIPSPRNVRRATDEAADLQLKADIEARGLLQNLVVAPARKPRGRFTVEAGARRLRALRALAEEGELDAGHEVCCLVLDDGPASAQEVSLAENFQRLAMNPADECLAFGQLVEQGADAEGIARRFGLTVRFVEGRLRLAGLAPVVFEALGAGEITLDVAKAYAATADRERQAHVFEQAGRTYMGHHPDTIRRMIAHATARASGRRARFVGEEAYVAAGGRVERDLFAEMEASRWLDIALLDRLALEKMETIAAEAAASAGLAFVRPTLDSWIGHDLTAGLERVRLEPAPLTEAEQAEIDSCEAQIETLAAQIDDEDSADEALSAAVAQVRALRQRIEAITGRPPLIPDDLRPSLGTFLLLDGEGRPAFSGTYYRERPAEPAPGEEDSGGEGEGADKGQLGSGEPLPNDPGRGLSQALLDELSMQRRDILAAHVASDPAIARDLATFLMIDCGEGHDPGRDGSSLIASPPSDPVAGLRTPEATATLALSRWAEALDRGWTEGETRAQRFDAFRALPEAARAAWLAHAVARTLEASLNVPGRRGCAFHDHLARQMGIDVARWWRPTGANYFDRVPKAVTLAALKEVGGPAFAACHAKAKKAELSEAAQRIFAGELVAEAETRARALAWVPEAMRFTDPADAAAPPAAVPDDAAAAGMDVPAEGGAEPPAGPDGGEGVCSIASAVPLPRGTEASSAPVPERGGSGREADEVEPERLDEAA